MDGAVDSYQLLAVGCCQEKMMLYILRLVSILLLLSAILRLGQPCYNKIIYSIFHAFCKYSKQQQKL